MPVIDRLAVEVGADLDPLRRAFDEAGQLAAGAAADLAAVFDEAGSGGLLDSLAQGVEGAARGVRNALVGALSGAEVEWDQVIGRMARRLSDLALDSALSQVAGGNETALALGSLFGGFRARGGPVQPGQAYVVGEAGPEWFVPGLAGTVVPQAAQPPQPPVIVNITTPDAASFRQSQGQVAAAVGRALSLARRHS